MTSQSNPALLDTVLALAEGDMVTVLFNGQSRTVRIESVSESEYSRSYYTTSGKVRPGAFKGGCLTVYHRDHGITFQATMQQQTRYVTNVVRIGAAN